MKLQRFEVESYMTLHENNCRYNLADTVAKSLTLKELLEYDKKDSLEDLMNLSLDYGAIEGSHPVMFGPSYEYVVVTPLPSVWDTIRCLSY